MADLQQTDIEDENFIQVPVGTTSQRPTSPETGMVRWNTDENGLEFYNGTEWIIISS